MKTNDARTATCACGNLKLTVSGPPLDVYVCCCLECQKMSGNVFTYSAWFADTEIEFEGEYRSWRRQNASGRWVENSFCTTCGTGVFRRVLAFPGRTAISVGCFADPTFVGPMRVYWSSRKHEWFVLPPGAQAVSEQ
jgi:hypothetical protein